jgi:hypothetical protein
MCMSLHVQTQSKGLGMRLGSGSLYCYYAAFIVGMPRVGSSGCKPIHWSKRGGGSNTLPLGPIKMRGRWEGGGMNWINIIIGILLSKCCFVVNTDKQ